MKLFNPDSPFMTVLTRIADFIIINLLTLLLSIPIVTAGAALTAGYYVMLKIRRDEDSGIAKMFFKSFKENFRQSTVIWLIMIVVIGLPAYLLGISVANMGEAMPMAVKVMLVAVMLLGAFLFSMALPVQSRFSNTISGTIRTAILISVTNPPRSFLIIIMSLAPYCLIYFYPVFIPVIIMFGFSLPAFLSVCLYNKQFKKLEDKSNKADGIAPPGSEDEHIFSDESHQE